MFKIKKETNHLIDTPWRNRDMHANLRSSSVLIVTLVGILSARLLMPMRTVAEDIRYIDPSDAEGTSAAVVVPDEPQVHTAQFLALNAQGALTGKGRANEQIEAVFTYLDSALRLSDPTGNPTIVKLNVVAANLAVIDDDIQLD